MYRKQSIRFVLATLTTVAMTATALVGGASQAFAGTTGTSTITVGSAPFAVAYDAGNGDVYVANYGAGTVSVIDGSTNKVLSTITVGGSPYGVAYDAGNGDLYVADNGSNSVFVIDGSTNKVISTITVGSYPDGVVYDAGNGDVYVANSNSGTVSVIDSTNQVTSTITVGAGSLPRGMAYDAGNGDVYVANSNSGTVSVIDSTNQVTKTITVGNLPFAVAYDAGNGDVYVVNQSSGTVSVIDSTNQVTKTITVGANPEGVAYDAANGDVYVSNFGSGTVSVIDGSTNTVTGTPITVDSYPYGVAYDAGNGDVYVANEGSSTVSVIVPPLPTITNSSVGQGSSIGTTAITATPNTVGNTFAVQVTSTTPSGVGPGASVPSGATTYTSGTNILNVAVGDVVTLYEVNSGSVVAITSFTLTANDIHGAIVTYDANGASGTAPTDSTQYMVGSSATVAGQGNLTKTGYTFSGWNTKADGKGTSYASGSTLTVGTSNVTLYAQWTPVPIPPLSVGTNFVWNGQYGVPYNPLQLQPVSGQAPYVWSLVSGSLPNGLTLSSDGTISGTPTGPDGTSTFTVQVQAANGVARRTLSILIKGAPALAVTTVSLPSGIDGRAYSAQLQGMGVSPLSWSIASGSLPAGMSLNQDGTLTGTPSESGQFTFTVQVKDASANVVQDSIVLHIAKLGANQRVITFNGHAEVVPAFVRHNTTYMPIWYVMQLIKQTGIQSTWDGTNWRMVTANQPDLSNLNVGHGTATIYLNHTVVQKVATVAAPDPSTGQATTYMPVWYVMQILTRLGMHSAWDGTTWTVTK